MRDSSLRLLHHLRGSHELIRPCKADSLFAGKRAAWLIESSSNPNTTSTVAGPSHFPRWRGRPGHLQTGSAVLMLCTQCREGETVVTKSFRATQDTKRLTKENWWFSHVMSRGTLEDHKQSHLALVIILSFYWFGIRTCLATVMTVPQLMSAAWCHCKQAAPLQFCFCHKSFFLLVWYLRLPSNNVATTLQLTDFFARFGSQEMILARNIDCSSTFQKTLKQFGPCPRSDKFR